MAVNVCRFCKSPLIQTFVDLGKVPLSNSFLRPEQLEEPEPYYPLHPRVCGQCLLVQVPELQSPEKIFKDYLYFSSFSETWLEHARNFATGMTQRLGLNEGSLVVEIASNDGYLLRNFRERGIPVLGVEPAANVARVAEAAGIPTVKKFFGRATAEELRREGKLADLLVANNVLAHVPELNDFVSGMKVILKPGGILTVEFPHLMRLIERNQFDTIYHEHFSYFSLLMVERLFSQHGLKVFDVEELSTHGGSLRLFIGHMESAEEAGPRLADLRSREIRAGLDQMATYGGFAEQVFETKRNILELLIRLKKEGKSVVAYGAPAKGTILLNYCGIREDFLDYAVDLNPAKQGLWIPGTRIPIFPPKRVFETKPDYLLLLAWNLQEEVLNQMDGIREWGGRFVVPIPRATILP